jgi:hypothetical protein
MTSLRKGSTVLGVTYSDGGYTNNLFGSAIAVEMRDGRFTIVIDMTSNFRVRNKGTNTYLDAEELATKRGVLSAIQIDETKVIDGLVSAWNRAGHPSVFMRVLLATHGTATYQVRPETVGSTLYLNVVRHVDV